jgi:membrane fusion protein (multidrug efflux system)
MILQVEASLAEQKAKTKKLKQDAERAQRLFERGVIADSERDTAVLEYETAVARERKADAALALIKEGTRKEEIAEARATVALRQAELAVAEQSEKDAVIKSPVTGYVVRKHVEEGEWTQIGGTVVDVIDTSVLRVHTRVTETKVRLVQRGQKALVRLDAYPGETLDATVHRVVPKADDTSRSFPVQLDMKDPKGRVRAGMFARVAFILSEREGVLLVPEDAVVLRGGMAMVFKAVQPPPPPASAQPQGPPPSAQPQGPPMPGPMMMAERVIVRTGERQEGNIEITEVVSGSLEAGDLLVVVGGENMGQGAMMIVVKGLPAPPTQKAKDADEAH